MTKKIISLFLVAILYCEITVADNYAILISAGKATADNVLNNSEHWFDLYLAYEYLLLYEQYDSSNIFFYGDGNDYNTGHNRYRKELHNWGQITDFDNSQHSMYSVIRSLDNVITDDDNLLFYWVAGHGHMTDVSDYDSYYASVNYNPYNLNDPNSYDICKSDLVDLVNSITHYNRRKIVWMTCYSGAMGEGDINVKNDRTTLVTSSKSSEVSLSHSYSSEPHTDFGYALYSLSTGKCPDGTTCNLNQYCLATALEDSLLSVNELHSGIVEFIVQNASYYQHPCIFDEGGISNKVFIGENKKLKDVFIGSNSSYWLDDMVLSNVLFDNNLDISIDADVKLEIKKNTFVPKGTTLIIK